MSGGFGLPRIDFTPLSQLGAQFAQNARSRDIGTALQAGDYATAAKVAFDAGDPDTGLNLMKLGEAYKTRQLQQAESAAFNAGLGGAFGGQAAPAPAASAERSPTARALPSFAQGSDIGRYATAIQSNESGGNYKIVGPTHPKYGRALGAYQVMESNLPSWSRETLGREVSPDEFLASPQIQDAIFQKKFGQAVEKYGNPQDAASVWFTGRPLAQGANARDVLGTTGQRYVDKFNAALGRTPAGQPPALPATAMQMPAGAAQVATADMPAPDAQPAQFQIPPGSTVANRPVEAISQSPLGQRIPFLLRAAGNPNLPEPQRDLAKLLLKQGLDESKLPDEQKDYLLARSQGFGGTFLEYKRELRGGDTGVTLSPGQQRFERGTDGQMRAVAGVPDREKSNDGEAKLRGEFTKQLGTFNDVQDGFRRVIAATEQREANPNNVSAASDISLIFGFMKMLDPGSVVREGEFATAQNAAGIPERIQNLYNKALQGEFLTPSQRQDFVDTAGRLYGQARQTAETTATRYRDLAAGQGLNADRVVNLPAAPAVPRVGPQRSSAPRQSTTEIPEGATATNPQTGEKIIFRGGQWVPSNAVPNGSGPIL